MLHCCLATLGILLGRSEGGVESYAPEEALEKFHEAQAAFGSFLCHRVGDVVVARQPPQRTTSSNHLLSQL